MSAEILIVDDNADIRNIINELIIDAGYKTRIAANYNQALAEIDKKLPDVAILDVKLDKGDNDGIELLSHIKTKNKDVPVIIISGHANIEMAIKSLHHGAFEFIEKPFDQERLLNFISRAVENFNLKKQNKEYESKLFSSYDLIGESKNTVNIIDQIKKISLTESRVFICGPSGSGKELVARKIHKNSLRNKNSFIVLNGALLDSNKYELELFGEEKENGAISYGALEKASGGTLLIDEISEIQLETQSKILRVLTDQKFKRTNGNHDINVDVRIICSSTKDIKKEIELGNFREDLYHRLNVLEINVEPLNKRVSDIPLLIEYFSEKISSNYNLKKLKIDADNQYLINYEWPGNVRELEHAVERAIILSDGNKLMPEDFNFKKSTKSSAQVLTTNLEDLEKMTIEKVISTNEGNMSKVAKELGIGRTTLYRKLEKYDLQ